MEFCSFDSGEGGEHNAIDRMMISNIFLAQDNFGIEMISLERVYYIYHG